jgi:plastocyanin
MTARRVLFGTTTIATLVAAAGFAFSAAAHPTATHPTLFGTVGKNDAYTIKLLSSTGKRVTKLKHGTYRIVIHDDSSIHNYELDGPHGKSWTFTTVAFKGTKTFTLKLPAGKYKAYCAPHESMMFQHFTLT